MGNKVRGIYRICKWNMGIKNIDREFGKGIKIRELDLIFFSIYLVYKGRERGWEYE